MKITIKTLQQKVFQIDAEGSETVGDLKQRIFDIQGHAVESQKIIYAGKVLPDAKTIESCEIKEKDFLVLMVAKPKPTPSAAPSTSAAPAPAPVAPVAPVAPAVPAAPSPAAAPPAAPAPAAAEAAPAGDSGFSSTSSFLSGDALERAIVALCDMGFERTDVMRAMRASFNNPNRAAEYLMSGIPEGLEAASGQQAPPPAAPAAAPAPAAQAPAQPAAGAEAAPVPAPAPNAPQNLFQLAQQQQQQQAAANPLGGGTGMTLQQLASSPQGAQMRQLVEQNPALLQPLLQQLAAANPGLAQAIAANPELLFQILAGGPGGEYEGEEGDGPLPPGAHVIELTEEERGAVQRLEALGFPRQAVLEAYLACDKNEELAANYLFENGFED